MEVRTKIVNNIIFYHTHTHIPKHKNCATLTTQLHTHPAQKKNVEK